MTKLTILIAAIVLILNPVQSSESDFWEDNLNGINSARVLIVTLNNSVSDKSLIDSYNLRLRELIHENKNWIPIEINDNETGPFLEFASIISERDSEFKIILQIMVWDYFEINGTRRKLKMFHYEGEMESIDRPKSGRELAEFIISKKIRPASFFMRTAQKVGSRSVDENDSNDSGKE